MEVLKLLIKSSFSLDDVWLGEGIKPQFTPIGVTRMADKKKVNTTRNLIWITDYNCSIFTELQDYLNLKSKHGKQNSKSECGFLV